MNSSSLLSSYGPLLLALALLAALHVPGAAADDGWIQGRATFYDDNKQGSCHYKDQIPEMYAAWPDTLEGFEGSCGTCLEVACVNKDFNDNYGGQLERSNACYDITRTVVVKIVDSCPCVHANAYSNRRWCCGDMKHVDLGRAAFKRLASENWGVIGLQWRKVDCSKLGSTGGYLQPDKNAKQTQQGGSQPQPPQQQYSSGGGYAPAWGHIQEIISQYANGGNNQYSPQQDQGNVYSQQGNDGNYYNGNAGNYHGGHGGNYHGGNGGNNIVQAVKGWLGSRAGRGW